MFATGGMFASHDGLRIDVLLARRVQHPVCNARAAYLFWTQHNRASRQPAAGLLLRVFIDGSLSLHNCQVAFRQVDSGIIAGTAFARVRSMNITVPHKPISDDVPVIVRLFHHIHHKTFGRLHDLNIVQTAAGRIQISAIANTRFVGQLAEWAVFDRLAPGDVDLTIQVQHVSSSFRKGPK